MRLDAHQHFWKYSDNSGDFPWMTDELGLLRRDFLPEDLDAVRARAGIDGSIAVQAREMEVETDFLLELAAQHSLIKGVVGWIDLCSPDVEARLDRYADVEALKGVRMLIHDRKDPDFADSAPHRNGISCLESRGLTYDLLLRTIHIPAAIRLVDSRPNQRFVVDHIAKPRMDGSDRTAWQAGMKSIAERPNVMCKLSGLVTETDWSNWTAKTITPFLETILEAFGPYRLMIGSDWPVCTLAAEYGEALAIVIDWSSRLSEAERTAVLGSTCAQFYSVS